MNERGVIERLRWAHKQGYAEDWPRPDLRSLLSDAVTALETRWKYYAEAITERNAAEGERDSLRRALEAVATLQHVHDGEFLRIAEPPDDVPFNDECGVCIAMRCLFDIFGVDYTDEIAAGAS